LIDERFSRSVGVWGTEFAEKLSRSHVAVFGLGGVGSFAVEALARAGIGKMTLIDFDRIALTNINRQIHALDDTLGRFKTEVMAERILNINPALQVMSITERYQAENRFKFFEQEYDYVIDAIDDVAGKVSLAQECAARKIPLISCMGTGNKIDPTAFRVTDVFSTAVDPLARVMRRKLKAVGVDKLKVVYSPEEPIKVDLNENGKLVPGSVSFVPPVAGFILAGEVLKSLKEGK